MENIGNGLLVSSHSENKEDGQRKAYHSTVVYVEFQGASGEVELRDGEWPEDGVIWDVCPAEWESLETDIQDWTENTTNVMKRLKSTD
jgi:hypothetical protein